MSPKAVLPEYMQVNMSPKAVLPEYMQVNMSPKAASALCGLGRHSLKHSRHSKN